MNAFSLLLLANFAVVKPDGHTCIADSFIRDDIKPAEYESLTENAKRGRTHLAASGTGFFITEDGYLLTNHHVVDQASEVVIIYRNCAYRLEIVAKNKDLDLVLGKVNFYPRATNGVYTSGVRPKATPLAAGVAANPGDTLYAIGFPKTQLLGYEPKITRGIMSSQTGLGGQKDRFQMDAMIDSGNSGGPVVDEYGFVQGIATAGLRGNNNCNYAVTLTTIRNFLPKNVRWESGTYGRRPPSGKMAKRVTQSVAFILVYHEGACEKITSTAADPDDTLAREQATRLKQALLAARRYKLRREWEDLLKATDWILSCAGDVENCRAWNEQARDELGHHLVIRARADGKDVDAQIRPICGFKEGTAVCNRPLCLFDSGARRGFPVKAKLSYEDDDWFWGGELNCTYDWHGTKEINVTLKRIDKK